MEEMMVSEAVAQGTLGVWFGMVITQVRNVLTRFGLSDVKLTQATLALSYAAAALSAMGVHSVFEGDFITGGTLHIQFPDAYHLLNGAVLFASNMAGQKGWVVGSKAVHALNRIAALLEERKATGAK